MSHSKVANLQANYSKNHPHQLTVFILGPREVGFLKTNLNELALVWLYALHGYYQRVPRIS